MLQYGIHHSKAAFGLGWNWNARLCFSFFFFSRISSQILLLFIHCCGCYSWTVAAKFDFSTFSTQILLFTNPQISLFSNFFIKNGSHDTIHTFKNYFAQYFSVFSFSFQFSAISKRTLSVIYKSVLKLVLLFQTLQLIA